VAQAPTPFDLPPKLLPARRVRPPVGLPTGVLAIAVIVSACGGGTKSSARHNSPPTRSEIAYAHCMTSHGAQLIATGGGGFQGPGVGLLRAGRARAAQTACQRKATRSSTTSR
jgi:hypothetical protein